MTIKLERKSKNQQKLRSQLKFKFTKVYFPEKGIFRQIVSLFVHSFFYDKREA
jgi:hypothetical protein